jgi:hypothetical protein
VRALSLRFTFIRVSGPPSRDKATVPSL